MLFHLFNSQEEQREFGGSLFIEIQFCKLPQETKKIVAVSSIKNWQNDSLYINDENTFCLEYSSIFNSGIYNNLKSGVVDIYEINYYSPSAVDPIIAKLNKEKTIGLHNACRMVNQSKGI